MKYFCKDCSYQGTTVGSQGQCPGCGSFNLVRAGHSEEKEEPARWRLVLLAALWGYLGILILWKLLT